MSINKFTLSRGFESQIATNKVLRDTYLLLGLTLIFSSAIAGLALVYNMPPIHPIISLIGYVALLFLTNICRHSKLGVVCVFALTGFLGYTLGPILNQYLHQFANGEQLVMMALGSTGLIFFALSGYVLISRKDFSFLGGFLMAGMIVAFLAGIGTFFFHVPGLMLAVSALFVLLSSGVILMQTSQIIHGGETSAVMATVTLYVSLYNIFLSLLNLLGAFNGDKK